MLSQIKAILGGEAGVVLEKCIFFSLAAVAAFIGCGFLVAALFDMVAAEIGATVARLAFAGGFLLLALIIWGVGALRARSRRKKALKARAALASEAALLGVTAARALPVAPIAAFIGALLLAKRL